jgi:D-alanine---D-serine ligase
MRKKRIAILFGGCSAEHEVSLQSAFSVIHYLNKRKYKAVLIGITREGQWYRYAGEESNIPKDTWHTDKENCIKVLISPNRGTREIIEINNGIITKTAIDCAFPVLHGKNGEDGTLQGLFELVGIPFVGCDSASSALCMDKDKAHKIAQSAGIRVPKSIVLNRSYSLDDAEVNAQALAYPLFVKPLRSGSSFGISKVYQPQKLAQAITQAFLYDSKVIIEEAVDGFEVGCAILGSDKLRIGEVDEIETCNGFFDYSEKYSLKTSKIHLPARIAQPTAQIVKETADKIYRALGCSGFARVDMFLTPNNEIIFNEVNTIPGLTPHSRYPNMMKEAGIDFAEMLDKLIELSIAKNEYVFIK